MGDANRTKLCPNCVNYVADTDASCRHCGYAFDVGEVPTTTWQADAQTAVVTGGETGDGPGGVSWQQPLTPDAQTHTAGRTGKVVGFVVVLIVLASIAIPIWQ